MSYFGDRPLLLRDLGFALSDRLLAIVQGSGPGVQRSGARLARLAREADALLTEDWPAVLCMAYMLDTEEIRLRFNVEEDSLALLRRMAAEELPAEIVAWSDATAAAAAAQTSARLWWEDEASTA